MGRWKCFSGEPELELRSCIGVLVGEIFFQVFKIKAAEREQLLDESLDESLDKSLVENLVES